MAASILSLGMLTARAFWMVRRKVGLDAGSVPPDFTAMVMSLAMRANCFAMRFHRANIVCFLTSKMRPIRRMVHQAHRPCQPRRGPASAVSEEFVGAPAARVSGQLRLQDAHAPQLLRQAALDLAQLALQVHLLPLLEHRALLFAEPLFLDARPFGERAEEAVVLMRQARTQRFDVRVARVRGARQALAGACELHVEQRALDLEYRRALEAPRQADPLE